MNVGGAVILSDQLNSLSLCNQPEAMLQRIMSNNGVFYRHQKKDDDDITEEEKKRILSDLYASNPRLFMSRYFVYLSSSDCVCFDPEDYEISFYTKLIQQREHGTGRGWRKDVHQRNKRYAVLKRLKKEGRYFSNEKMREREPLLFDRMIGKFLPEEEQIQLRPTIENNSLSGMLMQFEDSQLIAMRREAQLDAVGDLEDKYHDDKIKSNEFGKALRLANRMLENDYATKSSMYEDQSDSEEVLKSSDRQNSSLDLTQTLMGECSEVSNDSDRDEEQLKSEFLDHMEQRFLRGDDEEFFDYSTIDLPENTRELEKMQDQDLEDAYFDAD
ncbi:hypothetical protein AB6A40_001790 [Gnathostoma spinigerum]|uniref:CCD97-like C-terminal domain-containing protein n=1 Tax=Gnathostoma spinigerum TaxID=75299 RepID=A0ABD6E6A0_9BILA